MVYEELPEYASWSAVAEARASGRVEVLTDLFGSLLTMYGEEEIASRIEEVCTELAHRDEVVRGNAILSFGHLARRFGEFDNGPNIKGLVEAALVHPSQYVRQQAWAAAGDLAFFLEWQIKGFDSGEQG